MYTAQVFFLAAFLYSCVAQVLANGLSPLVRLLRQCWHEPYVAPESVRAALVLFGGWAAVAASDAKEGARQGQGRGGEGGKTDGAGGRWREW